MNENPSFVRSGMCVICGLGAAVIINIASVEAATGFLLSFAAVNFAAMFYYAGKDQ